MLLEFLVALPIFLAFPDLSANWVSNEQRSLNINVAGQDQLLNSCLKSGLELRYRFRVQLCKHRTLWADSCEDSRQEHHSLQFDPISENYKLISDRLGDKLEPESTSHTALEEALSGLTNVKDIPLQFLARGDKSLSKSKRAFISVRLVTDCKGDYNRTLAEISSFLTLGLVRISGVDSGWVHFDLFR